MKNKRTEAINDDSNKIPQSPAQVLFSLFWPLNTNLKKFAAIILLAFLGLFAVWASLPDKTKSEIIGYFKNSRNVQSRPPAKTNRAPLANTKKEIHQHTEGNQSPAVITNGDVNINIGTEGAKGGAD
jgi:hypothetical protein